LSQFIKMDEVSRIKDKKNIYSKISASLLAWICGLGSLMLIMSFTFSWMWAYTFMLEQGKDMEKLSKGFDFWLRIPVTFMALIILALISNVLDIQYKRNQKNG
jgi:lysylphosphatidylglycerol synthetase-like protein (DUF2156 family)